MELKREFSGWIGTLPDVPVTRFALGADGNVYVMRAGDGAPIPLRQYLQERALLDELERRNG